ncbi:MAG: TadE family protein [Kineosporiaceae bacterium]
MSARTRHRDDGSATVETAIVIPSFMLFFALVAFGGRLAIAHQAVQSAAADAARAASIERTQSSAQSAATSAATTSLTNQQVRCTSSSVALDVAGFSAPVGTPASVSATVTCTVSVSDLAFPGLSGTTTVTATMTSPIDTYRARQ